MHGLRIDLTLVDIFPFSSLVPTFFMFFLPSVRGRRILERGKYWSSRVLFSLPSFDTLLSLSLSAVLLPFLWCYTILALYFSLQLELVFSCESALSCIMEWNNFRGEREREKERLFLSSSFEKKSIEGTIISFHKNSGCWTFDFRSFSSLSLLLPFSLRSFPLLSSIFSYDF